MTVLAGISAADFFTDLRTNFPALANPGGADIQVFADNSSRAQMPVHAIEAMERQTVELETHKGGHPEHDFPRAARVAAMRRQARHAASRLCGGDPDQIGFAGNCSAALFVMAQQMFGRLIRPGDRIVVTEADHDANRTAWTALQRHGVEILDVPVDEAGLISMDRFADALDRSPKIVALCMISNVTGIVQPYERLTALAHEAGAVVVLDAVQGPPHGHTAIMPCGADIAVFSNCKAFAPHLGWWAARREFLDALNFNPPTGWSTDLEIGTLAPSQMAGFVGTYAYFADAGRSLRGAGGTADAVDTFMHAVRDYEAILSRRFLAGIAGNPKIALLGEGAHAAPRRVPIFTIRIARRDWSRIMSVFRERGIEARIGQFGTPATLRRLYPDDPNGLRVSFVHYNTPGDVDRVVDALDMALSRGGSNPADP